MSHWKNVFDEINFVILDYIQNRFIFWREGFKIKPNKGRSLFHRFLCGGFMLDKVKRFCFAKEKEWGI